MKKSNLIMSLFGLICSVSFSYGQYIPDPSFTQDQCSRVGHSNSDPGNVGGGMAAPKSIFLSGDFIYSVGKFGSDFNLTKKNKSNGVNQINVSLDLGLLLNGTVNNEQVIPRSLTVDPLLNRVYVVGHNPITSKGVVICLKTSNLTLDNTFNGNGILYNENGSVVTDVILSGSEIITTRNLAGVIWVSLYASSGTWLISKSLSSNTSSFGSTRIKKYPNLNRFYIVGSAFNTSTNVSSPIIFGLDYINNKTGKYFNTICSNSLSLSSEGTGVYFDLCFPFNLTTNKHDIVCVGSNSSNGIGVSGQGIYIKYIGITNTPSSFVNLVIDNNYKNQITLPGKGFALNEISSNNTVFSGCEANGENVLVCGSYGESGNTPHDLVVGIISNNGTNYTTFYHAVYGTGTSCSSRVIHYPGRPIYDPINNHLYLIGCDYGLSVLKMKQP